MAHPFEGEGPWSITAETGRAITRNKAVDLVFNFTANGHADNYLYVQMTSDQLKKFADSVYAAIERSEGTQ